MSEDRNKVWEEYQGNKPRWIRHNFLDYDRYHEAKSIAADINDVLEATDRTWKDISVLDFGCCSGDVGIWFARLGANVHAYDISPSAQAFANYRFEREGLINGRRKNYNLVVFGEVLEHMYKPLATLLKYARAKTEFIFTSSYPMRSSDPEDSYWMQGDHKDDARDQQEECRKLLEKYYDKLNLGGESYLWIRKEQSSLGQSPSA